MCLVLRSLLLLFWRCKCLVRQTLHLCQRGDEAIAVGLVAEALPDSPVDGIVGDGGGSRGDEVEGGGGDGGRRPGGGDGVPSILRKVSSSDVLYANTSIHMR